jgi:hypothetical protein
MTRLLAFLLALLFVAPSARADHGEVTPGDDDFNAVIQVTHIGDVVTGDQAETSQVPANYLDPCLAHPVCSDDLVCEPDASSPLGGNLVYYTGGPGMNLGWCDPGVVPAAVTPSMALRALRRIDLPKSELVVQPPGGATLVNFATNFYTEQGEFTRTVRLLGQRVELRIWPSQFGWRFGDGRSLASASAGAPYPDLQITHEYATKGPVRPSVDTTYAAQFRVNGGPWRDVNGTVTIPGSPVRLRVRTATPVLVGYH